MSQINEESVPKLARTKSIYPTLDQSKSFSSIVKGYIEPKEEEERHEVPPPRPQTPFNATQKLMKRQEHWEHQFNYEFNKEVTDAVLESRIANWYSATEKAAYQCKLEIPKSVLYSISFHPELETPPHILAKQVWNYLETHGFNISPTSEVITCVDTPKEHIDSELDMYTGPIPDCKPEYRPKIQINFAGQIDAFSLRRQYERSESKLTYATWLQSAKIPEILKNNQLQMGLPVLLSMITNEKLKIFYIQKWEDSFDQIKWTFDHWFDHHGYSIPWPKTDPIDKQELQRYRLPTWPTPWPKESDFQTTPQVKDTVKFVSPNMTLPDEPNTPSSMEAALAYLRSHGDSIPNLHSLFQKWVDDDKHIEFEAYAKAVAMPKTLPMTKEAWQRYRSHSFTSSQEDSLTKHMENINLSSSTPMETKKALTSFKSKNPQTYDKAFGAAAILTPATPYDFLTTATHIQGNYKMDKNSWPLLMSISPNDFRPNGRFAHIFIPKYVYVPKEIFTFLDFHLLKGNPLYQLTWQFCYAARREADKWITHDDIDESVSHWTDILLNLHGLNNMNMSLIDVVQAQAAHKWKSTMSKEETDPFVWYDLFIRPTEVLFARKAAMNEKLVCALKCQQHTTDLFQLVCNLVNLPNTIPLTSIECVEEMSKIRHLPAKAMIQVTETDIAVTMMPKVRLECSNTRVWDNICEADLPPSASSSGRGSFSSIANPPSDVQQSYIDTRMDECQYELQQIRELKRKTNDFLYRAERETSPVFGQQPTSQKEFERKYYHTRLQFLDIKMETLQEEYDLLHSQREYIEKTNKSIFQMNAQELEDVIYDMQLEKRKIEKQYQQVNDLICQTPDTKENEEHRFQLTYSMRLIQIRLKKLEDEIEDTKRQRHIKRMEGESHPNAAPPTQKSILSVKPKNPLNYPDPTFYKQKTNATKEDPYTGLFDIPKYSTAPAKQPEEKKKITPSLPVYGYVAKQAEKGSRTQLKKPIKTYQAEMRKPNQDMDSPRDWTNLKLSASEYVHNNFPMVESDDPKIVHHPLYRKFNTDGLNDYCQIILETSYDRNHEVLVVKELLGHPTGWNNETTPIQIPMNLAHDFIDKIRRASETRLDTFSSDAKLNRCLLFHTTLEKHQAKFTFAIQSEIGPQGRERLITIQREYTEAHRNQSIKIPWLQLPRLLTQLKLFMEEYEYSPANLKNS